MLRFSNSMWMWTASLPSRTEKGNDDAIAGKHGMQDEHKENFLITLNWTL